MPDLLPLPPAGTASDACPYRRSAAERFRLALDRGQRFDEALVDLQAYFVVLRPGLPRVLAREQAEAIAAAVTQQQLGREQSPRWLDLAPPSEPSGFVPWCRVGG